MKPIILIFLCAAIVGLGVRGYFVYRETQVQAAAHPSQSPSVPGKTVARNSPPAPGPAASAAAAAEAERQDIEASLRALHLTTIMPGQPGLVIIDKQEYSEGESLPLPKGRKARIVAVQDDGVQFTCNNVTFHLDAPAGPDLAALRKKRP